MVQEELNKGKAQQLLSSPSEREGGEGEAKNGKNDKQ